MVLGNGVLGEGEVVANIDNEGKLIIILVEVYLHGADSEPKLMLSGYIINKS